MRDHLQSLIGRTLSAALFVAGLAVLRPATAEAQARGTLQVFAQVVDTKASSEGLQAARVALGQVATGAVPSQASAASTLAQVRVARAPEGRSDLVVTIDYSK